MQDPEGRVVRASRGVHLANTAEVGQSVLEHAIPRLRLVNRVRHALDHVLVLKRKKKWKSEREKKVGGKVSRRMKM